MQIENKDITYLISETDRKILIELAEKLGIKPEEIIIKGVQVMQLYAKLKEKNQKLIIKDVNNNEKELTIF